MLVMSARVMARLRSAKSELCVCDCLLFSCNDCLRKETIACVGYFELELIVPKQLFHCDHRETIDKPLRFVESI